MIDSNSNHQTGEIINHGGHHQGKSSSAYSTATITKRRHPNNINSKSNMDVNLINIDYGDENNHYHHHHHNHNQANSDDDVESNNNNNNNIPLEQHHYNDILDVQVIAKMQEESQYK